MEIRFLSWHGDLKSRTLCQGLFMQAHVCCKHCLLQFLQAHVCNKAVKDWSKQVTLCQFTRANPDILMHFLVSKAFHPISKSVDLLQASENTQGNRGYPEQYNFGNSQSCNQGRKCQDSSFKHKWDKHWVSFRKIFQAVFTKNVCARLTIAWGISMGMGMLFGLAKLSTN